MWYILESLVSAGYFLEKHKVILFYLNEILQNININQVYHGDIRPANILLTPEGFLKIGDHGLLHVDQINYFKTLSGSEKTYLSPLLMKALQRNDLRPGHVYSKRYSNMKKYI